MDTGYVLAAILATGAVTFALRALPFPFMALLKDNKAIAILGRLLPTAIMLILVLASLRGVEAAALPWLAHVGGIAATALLHLWRRNALLSIFGGTGLYMLLQRGLDSSLLVS
ncbi:branched-chain amino acid transporter permease [Telmatospirillum sp. J64-1]|uniref:branched-chain amino acid transporter permease n=1 Tax=Telmatospirillum sp. J64-1 TaxID=2502183 RepID=UPI001C8F277B|nr:AzlD domain-containing protein [Telmatospirillum sp. J64-1]